MVHFVRNMDTGSCAAEGWIVNSRIGPLLDIVRYYGMDLNGEPAYGLIFGSFMAAGEYLVASLNLRLGELCQI